jgi:hypothetical protein
MTVHRQLVEAEQTAVDAAQAARSTITATTRDVSTSTQAYLVVATLSYHCALHHCYSIYALRSTVTIKALKFINSYTSSSI